MYKIGLSSCAVSFTEECFRKLKQSGVDAIELSMSMEQLPKMNYKNVWEWAKRYDIDLWSYHLPFAPFSFIDISSKNPELRHNAITLYTELIAQAADIGIDKIVIHPSGEPIAPEEREDRALYSMESLDRLAEIAHRDGAVIAVEDLPRTCLGNTADDMLRLLRANDKLRVCFDTNHLLKDTNRNFMEKLGDKIITVHISDYDFIDEKHWLPGEGFVDWKELYEGLCRIGYSGVWMYELGLQSTPKITRERDLTFEDFVRNAHTIFEGKTPGKISSR